ncbi:MAG TPA: 6,7-dimethyl-8-ribityllumazine synthase [Terriglobales bacterium]|nr:6,7-dimethyl-8-ribityllumazine synthase [Terriglobales bacterium]
MLKSLHIGRYTSQPEHFRKVVEFFEAIGFDRVSEDGQSRSAVLSAPLGLLSINALPAGYPPEISDRLKDVAKLIVIEVDNPDAVFEIAQGMKLKVMADKASPKTGERSFSLELPGDIVLTIHGRPIEQVGAVEGKLDATGKRFAIVVSRFNSFIGERLLSGALDALRRTGAATRDIEIMRVPGSFEIPAAARILAQAGKYDAIICLGCLLRGETAHYEVIANEVTRGIGQSAQETGVPHAFGVLTCDTLEQAIDRAGLKSGNKGFEAALAAVEMANLKQEVGSPQQSGVIKKKQIPRSARNDKTGPSKRSKSAKPKAR